ncbi:MAG: hypothetical protein F4029_09735 [Gammaproteobacteria bacterium]|nr:hypothetical protein [Gammaproteobacteria bacterium]MYK46499.1 hypothetical protein [Gammaproteobacteria bacterium]
MKATVIDTLRYANRLKEAGVEAGQAETMSRALNDELIEGLATKGDLDNAVSELGGKIDALDAKFEVRFAGVDARFAEMEGKFDVRFAGMEGKLTAMEGKLTGMDGKLTGMDGKFEAVDAKIDGLRSQNRYVFLVLALIAGLGFYNATAPHFLGKIGQPVAESSRSAPAAEVPTATDTANTSSFVSSEALPPPAARA